MKINIGVTEYDLKLVPEEELKEELGGEDKAYFGLTDYVGSKIKVNNAHNQQTKKQTFWHEIVHAMLDEIGMNELNADEGFVDALGKQVYGVIKKNKLDKIYAYLGD